MNLPDLFENDEVTLTDREVAFLEALFGDAEGNPHLAKTMAGYPPQKQTSAIVKRLKKQILLGTQLYLAEHAPQAVMALVKIATSTEPVIDAKNRLEAAKQILDRVGIVKTEQKTVTHNIGGVALLPPKAYNRFEDEEYEEN